jgi:hypothetical protein
MIIKPLGSLISVTSANTVANSNLVRIHTTNITTVTIADSNANVLGTISIPANFVEIIEKHATDTIACSASANCTPVAYKS